MMIPTAHPVVMFLPSLDHRRFCDAGLARGHPDSGRAAIMGVPLPHLVLPLLGCVSRRTPRRATRGEARGHRSVLAQKPLFIHPSSFLYLDLSSVWCVLAIWWTGPRCLCAAVATCLSGVVRSRYFVDMWVAEGHTARLLWLCVCCVSIAGGVDVDRRRACPHSRDVGAWYTARCQWCCDPLGHNGCARL